MENICFQILAILVETFLPLGFSSSLAWWTQVWWTQIWTTPPNSSFFSSECGKLCEMRPWNICSRTQQEVLVSPALGWLAHTPSAPSSFSCVNSKKKVTMHQMCLNPQRLASKRWLWTHNWEAGFGFFYPYDISAVTRLQDLEQCVCISPPTKAFQNYHSFRNFDWCL